MGTHAVLVQWTDSDHDSLTIDWHTGTIYNIGLQEKDLIWHCSVVAYRCNITDEFAIIRQIPKHNSVKVGAVDRIEWYSDWSHGLPWQQDFSIGFRIIADKSVANTDVWLLYVLFFRITSTNTTSMSQPLM